MFDGNFYGTAAFGGQGGAGTVFKITPAGGSRRCCMRSSVVTMARFHMRHCLRPLTGLSVERLCSAGTSDSGTVFKITPAGVETVLYAFTGGNDGSIPRAPLLQAADGNFYGTTTSGGSSSAGTLFKITPAGVETVLYSFTGG